MQSNMIIFVAIACLLGAVTSDASVVTIPNVSHPTTASIEVLDPYYLYVKDMEEFDGILEELDVIFNDLQIGGLKDWFKNEMKVSGLIVQVPVIKGQEHRYASLLERYGKPQRQVITRRITLPREDDEVTEAQPNETQTLTTTGTTSTMRMVSPSISTSSTPIVVESDSRKLSPVGLTQVVSKPEQLQVQVQVPETGNEKDWFYENPAYNQIRYSMGHVYQLFPELARLMGYMDSRDCRVHSLQDTEFNISPRYFVNSLITVENLRRGGAAVPKTFPTVDATVVESL